MQALRCALSQEFDLVLMDVSIPDMDGLQVTQALRTMPFHAHTPILGVSGLAFDEDRRALDVGMNGYVDRPLDPETLYSLLWDLIIGPRGE